MEIVIWLSQGLLQLLANLILPSFPKTPINVSLDSLSETQREIGRLIQSSAWTIEYTNKSLFTAGRDYDVVDLTIKIKRKSAYTRRKILYPLFILAFMTVFVYLVPPESGERTALAITAVLTMVLSVQYLMDQLPESDDEPWCVFMARLNMAAMAISLLLTCLVLNVYYRKGTFMPRWIKFVFVRVLGRLVFVGNMACKSSDKSDTKFEINLESKANENVKKGADTVERKDDWVLLASVIDRCCMIWLTALAIGTAYTLSY